MAFLVAVTIVRPSAVLMMKWAATQQFGLIHFLGPLEWPQFIVGFLLLDLSFYYWHVANHKVSLLWRFHNVHHLDPDLDVSTGFRFHFGEVLLSTMFRIVQVSATGISLTTFAAYEVVFQANTLFHHSNVRLPIRLERMLVRCFVTPRMHGIHHSQVRRETNSNYGRGVLLVGRAPSNAWPERSAIGAANRHRRLLAARGQPALAHSHAAFSPTTRLLEKTGRNNPGTGRSCPERQACATRGITCRCIIWSEGVRRPRRGYSLAADAPE